MNLYLKLKVVFVLILQKKITSYTKLNYFQLVLNEKLFSYFIKLIQYTKT